MYDGVTIDFSPSPSCEQHARTAAPKSSPKTRVTKNSILGLATGPVLLRSDLSSPVPGAVPIVEGGGIDGQGWWRSRRRHVGLGARWGGEGEGWGQENTREKTDRFPLDPPLFFTTIPRLKYGIQPPSNSNLSKREKEL